MADPGLVAIFKPETKELYILPTKQTIILSDEEALSMMRLVCATHTHLWDKSRKSRWKCDRCGKVRRVRKNHRSRRPQ